MRTNKTANARSLIDPQIKKEAYRQVIAQKGLPFEMRVPTETTMKAIEDARTGKGKSFASLEDLFDDLGIY